MRLRSGVPSPSVVISVLALIVALGGTAYAAFSLPKNSVGTKQLRAAAVVTSKLKNGAVTAAKVNPAGLTVPSALHATSADTATTAGGAPPTGQAGGDLAGSYPSPTIAPAPAPTGVSANPLGGADPCSATPAPTMIFCGTSSAAWVAAGYADAGGVQVWRDRVGEIHIRGEARYPTSLTGATTMFFLPASVRPASLQSFPVAIGNNAGSFQTGSALLVVYPTETGGLAASSGAVAVFDPSSTTETSVFIGEVQFRTDS